jgi:hypothetical protein
MLYSNNIMKFPLTVGAPMLRPGLVIEDFCPWCLLQSGTTQVGGKAPSLSSVRKPVSKILVWPS